MPTNLGNLRDLRDALRNWLQDAHLHGWNQLAGDAPGNAAAFFTFSVSGFQAADYVDPNGVVDGQDFNTNAGFRHSKYQLAGDTTKEAVVEFCRLYDLHNGDARAIFNCQFANGNAGRKKLALKPYIPGWQCLSLLP